MYEKPYIVGDGISSQIVLDTKWHKRLEKLRDVEHRINLNINEYNETLQINQLTNSTTNNVTDDNNSDYTKKHIELLSYTVPRIVVIGKTSNLLLLYIFINYII